MQVIPAQFRNINVYAYMLFMWPFKIGFSGLLSRNCAQFSMFRVLKMIEIVDKKEKRNQRKIILPMINCCYLGSKSILQNHRKALKESLYDKIFSLEAIV